MKDEDFNNILEITKALIDKGNLLPSPLDSYK